jgi:hypothetical protein
MYLLGGYPSLIGKVKCTVGVGKSQRDTRRVARKQRGLQPFPVGCELNPERLKKVSGGQWLQLPDIERLCSHLLITSGLLYTQ